MILATRGSPLARWQAEAVQAALAHRAGAQASMLFVATTGDHVQDRPISAVGPIGVFTKEVNAAVLDGRADAAVHSLKDLATTLDAGLALAAVLPRGPAEDVLVAPRSGTIAALAAGARVATGSVRRRAMLLRERRDLVCVDIRGNVGTRLEKLARGEADALLMARAGLERIGLAAHITEVLELTRFLPAGGQALVGITCREDDTATRAALARINDADGFACALAERAVLAGLRAGCHAPVGVHAVIEGTAAARMLRVSARVLAHDGTQEIGLALTDAPVNAVAAGHRLAAQLLALGAQTLLDACPP